MMWCIGVTEAVIPNTGDTTTYIAVGVGGGVGLLVVVTGVVLLAVIIMRKRKSRQCEGTHALR